MPSKLAATAITSLAAVLAFYSAWTIYPRIHQTSRDYSHFYVRERAILSQAEQANFSSRFFVRERAILSQAEQANFSAIILGDSLVEQALIPLDFCNQLTLNAGIAGARIHDIEQFAPTIFRLVRPRTVIIAAGVNDAERIRETMADEFERSYKDLINIARGSGIKASAATVGPISNSGTLGAEHYSAERISSFNKIIRMLGVNVIDLAEVGDGGWLPSKLTSDGVHLNADGYVRWKEAMRRGC